MREAHREMLEESTRIAGIFRRMVGIEMVMKEKARREEEKIGRLESNIIGGIDQSNKERSRCVTSVGEDRIS